MLKNTPSSRTTCLPLGRVRPRLGSDQFTLANKPFTFAGWNQWEVVEASSNAPPPYRWTPKSGIEHVVTSSIERCRRGQKVVGIWVHPITEGYALRPTKTTWNEKSVERIGFLFSECEKREIKVVLVLADNWYDWRNQRVLRMVSVSRSSEFLRTRRHRSITRETINYLTYRTNSITKSRYRDDPTIMAWNLANEARAKRQAERGHGTMDRIVVQVSEAKSAEPFGIGRVRGILDDSETKRCGFHEPGQRWRPLGWTRRTRLFMPCRRVFVRGLRGDTRLAGRLGRGNARVPKAIHLNRAKLVNGKNHSCWKSLALSSGNLRKRKTGHEEKRLILQECVETTEKLAKEKKISGSMFWHFYDEGVGPGRFGVRTSDVSTWKMMKITPSLWLD